MKKSFMTTNDIHAHMFRVSSSLCTTSIKMTSYEWFAELGASVLLNIYASKKKILSFFLVHYALHILILKHMHILPIHTHVTPLSLLSKGNKTCFHTFHYHQCRGALSPLKHYAFSSIQLLEGWVLTPLQGSQISISYNLWPNRILALKFSM